MQSLFIISLYDQVFRHEEARRWDTKQIYACYNNQIQPCDDKTIKQWNTQNPDKAITEEYLRQPYF